MEVGQNRIPPKCEICDKEFKNNKRLKNHFNIIHNFKKECQNSQNQLTMHLKSVHANKKDHKCESCRKLFTNAGNLKKHINTVQITNVSHVERHFLKHGT